MKIPIFQVDAFTGKRFSGNPAAVCPLDEWLPDDRLGEIAAENNLSETAFFVRENDVYHLRWFTPTTEVDLCGHATLASAFVLWDRLGSEAETLRFRTRSGMLSVRRQNDLLVMSFPVLAPRPVDTPATLEEGKADFVSRYFAVPFGVPEDPVTGSIHCTLTPYWAERLGKHKLHAQQVSDRGGELFCELYPDHVEIAGRAVLYLEGTIHV